MVELHPILLVSRPAHGLALSGVDSPKAVVVSAAAAVPAVKRSASG